MDRSSLDSEGELETMWPLCSWGDGYAGNPLKEAMSRFSENQDQAPVVQTLDRAIHRINHYPADKY